MNDSKNGIDNFTEEIRKALSGLEFEALTAVQQEVIPLVLAQQDVIVTAQTGSGKTAAFGIPVCEKIAVGQKNPQVLVLAPTRELAVQIKQDMANIGRFKKIRCAAVFGRYSMEAQKRELAQRVHVIVGTPGRTLDHINKANIKLDEIRYLVIDEADKLLEMGFIEQVEAIINLLPAARTTLLFSATMPERIAAICSKYMRQPVRVEVAPAQPQDQRIRQSYCEVAEQEKLELLHKLLFTIQPNNALLFCNTREKADAVAQSLQKVLISCESLHGGLEQRERLQRMERFKRGEIRLLAATDVAARGVHVDELELVVNIDFPLDKETYVHRIGRAGRNGNEGMAITFCSAQDSPALAALEDYLGYNIVRRDVPSAVEAAAGKAGYAASGSLRHEAKSASSGQLNNGITRIRISAGKKKKMRAGDIVGAVSQIAGISATDIGIIDIQEACSYVEIHGEKGNLVLAALPSTKIKGKIYSSKQVPCCK